MTDDFKHTVRALADNPIIAYIATSKDILEGDVRYMQDTSGQPSWDFVMWCNRETNRLARALPEFPWAEPHYLGTAAAAVLLCRARDLGEDD